MSFKPDWSHIIIGRDAQPLKGRMNKRKVYKVEAVYPASVAAAAGVQAGWFYKVDGAMPLEPSELKTFDVKGDVVSTFYDLKFNQVMTLKTKGFPFGMALGSTVENLGGDLADGFRPVSEAADAILEGVSAQEHQILAKGAQAAVNGGTMVQKAWPFAMHAIISLVFPPYLLFLIGRFFYRKYKAKKYPLDLPFGAERIIAASYAARVNDFKTAKKMLPDSEHGDVKQWGTAVMNLYYYTAGKIAQHEKDDALDHHLYILAEHLPITNLSKDFFKEVTGEELMDPPKQDKIEAFVGDYSLPLFDPYHDDPAHLEQAEYVSFRESLKDCGDQQFILLIGMGSYRSNGPYDGVMRNLTQMFDLLRPYIAEVHMITSYNEGPNDAFTSQWLQAEEQAIEKGIPLNILYDEDHIYHEFFAPNIAPHGVIINKSSLKVFEGSVSEGGAYWTALDALDKVDDFKVKAQGGSVPTVG